MVARRLVDLIGRASAANILGISVRELDKLVEIYELSARFTGLRDPTAASLWVSARNCYTRRRRRRHREGQRKARYQLQGSSWLHAILPDPVAREQFLSGKGDLGSAVLRIAAPATKDKSGFASDLDAAVESMKRVPWTALVELRGDPELLKKNDDAQQLLASLRKTLSS
jgi:ParB family chromosome partitioning protein